MAEQRFPSIEDFSEDTPIPSGPAGTTSTNEQSFLDRERAALGDDADFFASPGDARLASVEDGEDDLLGGGDEPVTAHSNAEELEFEQNFPSIDTRNNAVGPGGTVTGAQGFSQQAYSSYNAAGAAEEEPEVIKEWRERRTLALNHRAEVAADKKAKTIAAAHTNIDEFYGTYNNKKDKTVAATRKEADEFLANRDDTTAGGTSWERIAKLVDLSGGKKGGAAAGPAASAGKDKFRELLTSLRKDGKAPGASGV